MSKWAYVVAIVLAAAAIPTASAARADLSTVAIPGPKVTLSPELRVGRRYKLVLTGTGSSRQGVAPDFDWLYCFEATCKFGVGKPIALVEFCDQQASNFQNTTPIAYRPDHTYQLTVERTFDSPGPGGVTNSGQFVFRNAAGDEIGSCQRGENESGALDVDPSSASFDLLDYIEGGRLKHGPGGTFQIAMTDVGSIARPPSTVPSTPASPQAPAAATSLSRVVVGKRYAVGASGAHAVSTGGRFTSSLGTYVARSASIKLNARFTYTSSGQGASVTGTAVVTLVLAKQGGGGQEGALPLTYRISAAAKWTPDKAAREWQLTGRLVKPRVTGCETGTFHVGRLARSYLSFSACGVSVFIRPAAVSIA